MAVGALLPLRENSVGHLDCLPSNIFLLGRRVVLQEVGKCHSAKIWLSFGTAEIYIVAFAVHQGHGSKWFSLFLSYWFLVFATGVLGVEFGQIAGNQGSFVDTTPLHFIYSCVFHSMHVSIIEDCLHIG